MRSILIGIGGGHSSAGKTALACKILEKLPGWGAIKCTRTTLYSSITDDITVLSKKGKDTRRFLDSGTEKVLWVQSPFNDFDDILPMAVEMLSHLSGIVIEGNSAIDFLRPDIVIFVHSLRGHVKKGAVRILKMADIVICDGDPPPETPQNAAVFGRDEEEKFLGYLLRRISGLHP